MFLFGPNCCCGDTQCKIGKDNFWRGVNTTGVLPEWAINSGVDERCTYLDTSGWTLYNYQGTSELYHSYFMSNWGLSTSGGNSIGVSLGESRSPYVYFMTTKPISAVYSGLNIGINIGDYTAYFTCDSSGSYGEHLGYISLHGPDGLLAKSPRIVWNPRYGIIVGITNTYVRPGNWRDVANPLNLEVNYISHRESDFFSNQSLYPSTGISGQAGYTRLLGQPQFFATFYSIPGVSFAQYSDNNVYFQYDQTENPSNVQLELLHRNFEDWRVVVEPGINYGIDDNSLMPIDRINISVGGVKDFFSFSGIYVGNTTASGGSSFGEFSGTSGPRCLGYRSSCHNTAFENISLVRNPDTETKALGYSVIGANFEEYNGPNFFPWWSDSYNVRPFTGLAAGSLNFTLKSWDNLHGFADGVVFVDFTEVPSGARNFQCSVDLGYNTDGKEYLTLEVDFTANADIEPDINMSYYGGWIENNTIVQRTHATKRGATARLISSMQGELDSLQLITQQYGVQYQNQPIDEFDTRTYGFIYGREGTGLVAIRFKIGYSNSVASAYVNAGGHSHTTLSKTLVMDDTDANRSLRLTTSRKCVVYMTKGKYGFNNHDPLSVQGGIGFQQFPLGDDTSLYWYYGWYNFWNRDGYPSFVNMSPYKQVRTSNNDRLVTCGVNGGNFSYSPIAGLTNIGSAPDSITVTLSGFGCPSGCKYSGDIYPYIQPWLNVGDYKNRVSDAERASVIDGTYELTRLRQDSTIFGLPKDIEDYARHNTLYVYSKIGTMPNKYCEEPTPTGYITHSYWHNGNQVDITGWNGNSTSLGGAFADDSAESKQAAELFIMWDGQYLTILEDWAMGWELKSEFRYLTGVYDWPAEGFLQGTDRYFYGFKPEVPGYDAGMYSQYVYTGEFDTVYGARYNNTYPTMPYTQTAQNYPAMVEANAGKILHGYRLGATFISTDGDARVLLKHPSGLSVEI